MSKITLTPNASGTGTFTVASPNSNTNRTLTLPDAEGNLVVNTGTGIDVTGTVTADGLTVDGATGEFRGSGANTTYFTGGDDSISGRQLTLSSEASSGQNNATHRLTVPSGYGSFNVSVGGSERLKINNNGDISFYEDTGTTAKFFWDASAESLGIGTSSPTRQLDVSKAGTAYIRASDTSSSVNMEMLAASSGGWVGTQSNHSLNFQTNNTEAMRIDSSGNLLVGQSSTTFPGATNTTTGHSFRDFGGAYHSASSNPSLSLNRNTTDGDIVQFRKDGSTVGSIATYSDDLLLVTGGDCGIRLNYTSATGSDFVAPCRNTGALRDNAIDLGTASGRWDDVYATNGTIQTSDRNEKQDIEALSDAEQRVAVACKGLLRKFRWIDAVAEKGDDARIHFGIIAQDLQDAFAAEGLDAGRYAMFISTTWWETQTEVPAVEAVAAVYEDVVIPAVLDEDGNEVEAERIEQQLVTEAVEAKEAYTRTDTYETLEEAPEGATERTRLGVRYPELLAFIIGAM